MRHLRSCLMVRQSDVQHDCTPERRSSHKKIIYIAAAAGQECTESVALTLAWEGAHLKCLSHDRVEALVGAKAGREPDLRKGGHQQQPVHAPLWQCCCLHHEWQSMSQPVRMLRAQHCEYCEMGHHHH